MAGELISEQKLGNGTSLIIFSGIVISLPRQILATILTASAQNIVNIIIFFALLLAIIVGVVYISLAERRIPVSYAKQVRGTKIYGGASTYLPVKLNQAGVIPIIFALSILMFPQMIAQFLANSTNIYVIKLVNFLNLFQQNSPWYLIVYFLLVFIFTYFYTYITLSQRQSPKIYKKGGFIPGYRPVK